MARVRFFNGAASTAEIFFGEFTAASITSFTATRIVLTGADGQQFVAIGSGFAVNLQAGTVAGTIARLDWLDPDGGVLSITDQLSYPAQRAFDAVIGDPDDPNDPDGVVELVADSLSGNDVIFGAADGIGGYYADQNYRFNLIFVGAGNNRVIGGRGPERVEVGDGGTNNFDGGGGIDDIDYLFGSFEGTRGIDADLITGRVLNPFGGIDRVTRVENIFGTIFDDVIRGTDQANTLDSGAGGRDQLFGRGGNDELRVSFEIPVTGPDDTLNGGDGADILKPGIGADRIIGGSGFDLVVYFGDTNDPALIVVDLVNPGNNTGNPADDAISEVEGFEVHWGRFVSDTTVNTAIRFNGNAASNSFISRAFSKDFLLGNAGNDTLDGGFSDGDTVRGGDGNDVLFGGGGGDVIDGGAGFDVAAFDANQISGIDLLNPAAATGQAAGDRLTSIEAYQGLSRFLGNNLANVATGGNAATLSGRGGNDTLTGGVIRDAISGGAGNDRLDGGGSVDTINGGAGNDRISGGAGIFDDVLAGAAGNDIIIGGGRADTMSGGAGADVFYFALLSDTGIPGNFTAAARDHITDFQLGLDTLRFAAAGFAGLREAFGFIEGTAPRATGNAGTFLFDTDDGRLLYDSDGRGPRGASLLILLDDTTHLTRAAFDIV